MRSRAAVTLITHLTIITGSQVILDEALKLFHSPSIFETFVFPTFLVI